MAEELVARFTQMRRQFDESAATLKTVWDYRLGIDRDRLLRAATGIRQGTRKLLDLNVSTLRERALRLRHQVGARIARERLAGKGRQEMLRSLPLQRIATGRERVGQRRLTLVSRGRFLLGRAGEIVTTMRRRFARERFLRRVQTERSGFDRTRQLMRSKLSARLKIASVHLAGIKGRLRAEPIRQRLGAERKSLAERMVILRAHDPQRVLERGFALVYRQDGQLLRSDVTP